MIERHQRFGWSTPVGEWGAIQAENRAAFRQALDSGDPTEVELVLDDFFRGPLAFGLSSITADCVGDLQQAVCWRVALWYGRTRGPLSRLAAPNVGNPLALEWTASDGTSVPVMVDTPRFDYYASRILRTGAKYIVEIGGGYGGVALQVLRQDPRAYVVLVDIPETLYLADYWLTAAGVRTDWWDGYSQRARVCLTPTDRLLESIERAPDLVFSAHCLSGTTPAVIGEYMTWLGEKRPRYFYHDDVIAPVKGIWLNDTFPETLASEIRPPSPYRLAWTDRTPWTGFGDRFGEFFYECRS